MSVKGLWAQNWDLAGPEVPSALRQKKTKHTQPKPGSPPPPQPRAWGPKLKSDRTQRAPSVTDLEPEKSDEFLMGGEGLGDLVILIGSGSKTGGGPKLEIVRGPL